MLRSSRVAVAGAAFIEPCLPSTTRGPSSGADWLHEIKFDGYRMHARLDRGKVRLLTRTGLDWTHKYRAVATLPVDQAYLDGELCGVRPDGTTSFSIIQAASNTGNAAALVSFFSTCFTSMAELLGWPASRKEGAFPSAVSPTLPIRAL